MDRYAGVPEQQAAREYFDERNAIVFARLRSLFLPIALVLTIVYAIHPSPVDLALSAIDLVLLLAALGARESAWLRGKASALLILALAAQYLILVGISRASVLVIVLSAFVFPVLLLFARLKSEQYIALGTYFAVSSIVVTSLMGRISAERIIVPVLFNAAFAWRAARLAHNDRRAFLRQWRIVASRERERLRMRDEIADARRIQLAMLPESAPRLDWLDIASLSIPATEVGGDFYDYLTLPEGRIAIVIGDVAGHGVASGIVLAGVKSGLQLLRDDMSDPLGVVDRLNRVVRDWMQWRMLVSILLAIVDPVARRISVVAAGHPPLLAYSRTTGTVTAVGHGALPLGTRLPTTYRIDETPLSDGDVFLVYTDGVIEQTNAQGEVFGAERLERALAKSAPSRQPRIVREAITDELAHFKGDEPQIDDVSLVIGHCRPFR